MFSSAEAAVFLAERRSRDALESARRAIEEALGGGLGLSHEVVRLAFPIALEAAIDVDDLDEAGRLADTLAIRPRGEVPPFLRAQLVRSRGLLSAARGEDDGVEKDLMAAEAMLRDLGYPYWTARSQLDRAGWLAGRGRHDEAAGLAGEAAATFERLGTTPMFARAQAIATATAEAR